MTKEELIQFIRDYDDYFYDTPLENYSYEELELMKHSIDLERKRQAPSSKDMQAYAHG